ncbi:uncharacterized protein LOC117124500 [Anneissia japonica]|uniref:uncharacterized protein LOC117124500 n=1 Tax=Anneissia japonica TaxID=1529436 RepID=UPI00142579DB|nr:uncharacterized protein LOC117124500 [Anneissia japonica]
MCRDATTNDGFICQGRLETTRDTPTTSLDKIFTGSDVTTKVKMASQATFKQQPNDSKMPDAVIPISIALAVAVVCIAVLVAIILLKRRTPDDSGSGTNPQNELEKHDPVINQVNEQDCAESSSSLNQYSKYETSLPGDYAYLSDNVLKNHGPDYCVVEGDVYNGKYEYPMLPLSVENSNAETLLNDPSYDSLGPHYDVLNREEEGEQAPSAYDDLENGTEMPEYEYSYAYYTDLIK